MPTTTTLSTTEAGAEITRDDLHWGATLGGSAGPITFGFRTLAPNYSVSGEDVKGTFTPFSAAEQAAARIALATWASIANVTFSDLGNSNAATIEFANYKSTTDNSEAFAYYPGSTSASSVAGDVFVNTYYASTVSLGYGTYEYMTFLHEIGHALGLEHPADYNAGPAGIPTYQDSVTYVEDTRQYSLMSYFDESYTGGRFSVYDETPMLDDIAAIQRLYGANLTTRTGSDTYGFHSNLAGSPFNLTSALQHVVFTAYDCGGTDTFDFSGYSQSQLIDLNAEHFSDVGGDIHNVCIAQNVTIENAVGGFGDDTLIGNDSGNVLSGGDGNDRITGGGGNDLLDGGAGFDTAVWSGNRADYAVSYDSAAGGYSIIDIRTGSPDGKDIVKSVEYFQFHDGIITAGSSIDKIETRVLNDFDGDGRSDILWRNDDGGMSIWEMDGLTRKTSGSPGSVETQWHIDGTADFDDDGRADILWRHDVGDVYIWEMTGFVQKTGASMGNVEKGWHIIGAGDFDGDGKSDILWRHDNGGVFIWEMNGLAQKSAGSLGNVNTHWHIAGTGDFDGDGKSDILWRHDNGDVFIWEMNGLVQKSAGSLGNVDTHWHIAGTGDFDGDGKSDILWRHDNGDVRIWEMSGLTEKAAGNLGNVGNGWQIAGTNDFDGDGKSDILWRHEVGDAYIWEMNGLTQTGGGSLGNVPNQWHIDTAGHPIV